MGAAQQWRESYQARLIGEAVSHTMAVARQRAIAARAAQEGAEEEKKPSPWKNWLNIALVLVPLILFRDQLGLGSDDGLLKEGPLLAVLAAITLFPLSNFLESAVVTLEELYGQFIGGLLHTTFDNAAEMAIALLVLISLPANDPNASTLVLSSVAGVVVRNSLLILGVATIAGALKHRRPMIFSAEEAGQYSTFFALAVTGLCLPTAAFMVARANDAKFDASNLKIFGHYSVTLAISIVLLVAYIAYLIHEMFRILTESRQKPESNPFEQGFNPFERPADVGVLVSAESESPEAQAAQRAALNADIAVARRQPDSIEKESRLAADRIKEGAEQATGFLHQKWVRTVIAVLTLGIAAALIVYMSEAFAGSIEAIGRQFPGIVNPFFLGLIVIPVVGGSVQLVGAINTAREREDKIELVMGITAGASIQMVTVVVPVLVIVGYLTNHPLLLNFNPLEVIIFVAASFLFMLLSRDGKSTILEGVQLCSLWALLAATAYFLPPHFAG